MQDPKSICGTSRHAPEVALWLHTGASAAHQQLPPWPPSLLAPSRSPGHSLLAFKLVCSLPRGLCARRRRPIWALFLQRRSPSVHSGEGACCSIALDIGEC